MVSTATSSPFYLLSPDFHQAVPLSLHSPATSHSFLLLLKTSLCGMAQLQPQAMCDR